MGKRALITGVTGQDGAYLAHWLLSKGYEVPGLVRRSSTSEVNLSRLKCLDINHSVHIVDGDLRDLSSLIRAIRDAQPD